MVGNKLIVGYWTIQGIVHPARLLLAYYNVPFEDKMYYTGTKWFKIGKPALKTVFNTIPYIKDGEFIITESLACNSICCNEGWQQRFIEKNNIRFD